MIPSKPNATILLIVDDAKILQLITTYFSSDNFTLLVATSSTSGIQKATTEQPDIILLDVLLGDQDGFETCRQLKAKQGTTNIPIIFLGPQNTPEYEIKGYQLGAVDFISKPLQEESILARIDTQLRLRALTERWEQKVEERTKELMQANQRLAQEIKERIAIETALRESEGRLREAQRIGNFGFLDWNIVDGEIEWSDQTYHIYGFEPQSMKPTVELTTDLVHPDDKTYVIEQIQAAFAGEAHLDIEHRVKRSDDQIIYVHVTADITRDEAGKPIRMLGTVLDVTARKKNESALEASELLNRTLVENAPVCIHEIDLNGRLTAMNMTGLKMMNLQSQEQIIGQRYLSAVAKPDRERIAHLLSLAYKGVFSKFEFVVADTKEPQMFASCFVPIHARDGSVERLMGITEDITERKKSEDALAQTANLLTNVINTSRDWIFVKDKELRTILCNEAFAAALGKTPDQLIGNTDIENGWDPDMVKGNFENGFHGYESDDLKVLDGETLVISSDPGHADGERRTFDTVKMPLRDEKREIIGVLGIARDVTERKLAEEALAESEQKYRSLIETMGEGFGMLDTEGVITYVNDSFCNMVGYAPKALIGIHVTNLVDETNLQILIEQIERTTEEGGMPYELAWQAKNGQNIPTITAPRVLKDKEGNFIGSFAVVTDIRKLKEAEQEQYLSDQILRQMPDAVIVSDLQGNIQRWLGGAEAVFGYRSEEVVGQSVSFLHHPDIRDSKRVEILHELEKRGEFFGEILCMHKDGYELPIEISIKKVFDPAGNPFALVSDSKDISRRKAIEIQVQRSERMAAIGQLSTGIAHDFNNILAAITLYTELLLRNPENTAVTYERLETILQQTKRASNLINQLLDFSRRSALERATINLLDPLQELITLLKRMLSENIVIKLVHESTEYMVHADPTRIQQIFMNLAVNARDAMPHGGELTFTLEHYIFFDADLPPFPNLTPGDWVRIEVSDTGTGMSEEIMQHIFEPFFTTKDPGKGTGLGLAQVYGIVKQHEGYIFIRSEVEKGSTFIVFLPTLPAQGTISRLRADHKDVVSGNGETILVVEDNPDTREAIVTSLEVLNYQVIIARNGVEALDVLQQKSNEIDLLLSDMIMPTMGGTALLSALQKLKIQLPIIMLSGYFLEDELDNLRALGMLSWLPKPPELTQLSQAIYKALQEMGKKIGE